MSEGDNALKSAFKWSTRNLWRFLGAIAVIGTVIPFLFFLFNIFGLSVTERVFASLLIFLIFVSLGLVFAIVYLYFRVQNEGYSPSELDLFAMSFEILNRDDGLTWDSKHIYELQERTLDLTGKKASLNIRFTGQVSRGETSDGVLIKYIGDDQIKGEGIESDYQIHEPVGEGEESKSSEAEIYKEVDTYSTILKLPFGTVLETGERFDIEFTWTSIEDDTMNPSVVRIHFPNHRFKRIDQFRGSIKIDSAYSLDCAAAIKVEKDISQFRDVLAEDIQFNDVTFERDLRTTHTEYTITDQDANRLYVARFLRE